MLGQRAERLPGAEERAADAQLGCAQFTEQFLGRRSCPWSAPSARTDRPARPCSAKAARVRASPGGATTMRPRTFKFKLASAHDQTLNLIGGAPFRCAAPVKSTWTSIVGRSLARRDLVELLCSRDAAQYVRAARPLEGSCWSAARPRKCQETSTGDEARSLLTELVDVVLAEVVAARARTRRARRRRRRSL